MILLDYRDRRPIYEQVVEKIERLIVSGAMEPEEKMPSVRSLAMDLSVNPNTIQRAYAQLEQEGYIYTVSGRGSFVAPAGEWRESKHKQLLEEWTRLTANAREAGLQKECLLEALEHVYGARADELSGSGSPEPASQSSVSESIERFDENGVEKEADND